MTATNSLGRLSSCFLLAALCLPSTAHSQELITTLTGEPFDNSVGTVHAISGDRAVLGVEGQGGRALRFYDRTPSGWVFDQEIPSPVTGFLFNLDMDGDVLVVGGSVANGNRLRFYERQADGTWSGTTTFNFQGASINKVVVNDGTVAVGFGTSGVSNVRLYRKTGSAWTQYDQITGEQDIFLFGYFMDLEGPWLAIGRPDQEQGGGGGGYAGKIRVYRDQGTEYTQTHVINGGPGLGFRDLDLDGDRLLTTDVGVKVYHYNGQGWVLEANLPVPPLSIFGADVALRDRTAVVGFPGQGDGEIHLFSRIGSTWVPAGRLVDESGLSDDSFGFSMDVSGTTLLVAGEGFSTMGTQVYDFPLGALPYGVCPAADSPCGNGDAYAGCLNSTGQGATLRVKGTASTTQDDLVFTMRNLPPNRFGLLYMGGASSSVVFGDGLRVVDAGQTGLVRFAPQQADSEGTLVQGPGLVALAGQLGTPVLAGAVWHLQGWYRDGVGGPCGSGFNLTNGIQVSFTP